MPKGPKPILDLADWRPRNLSQAVMLEQALTINGEGRTLAAALVMSLAAGKEVALPPATKTAYRRALARLGAPPWDPAGRVGTRSKGAYPRSLLSFGRPASCADGVGLGATGEHTIELEAAA